MVRKQTDMSIKSTPLAGISMNDRHVHLHGPCQVSPGNFDEFESRLSWALLCGMAPQIAINGHYQSSHHTQADLQGHQAE